MSKAFEVKNHYRRHFEALEARCLLAVDFVDSGQELADEFTRVVALGDLDGDGDLDVFAGASLLKSVREDRGTILWRNDGRGYMTGSFSQFDVDPISRIGLYDESIALGDLDEDGDVDAITFGRPFFNDGTGTFVQQLNGGGSAKSFSVLGDLDGDGDLDTIGPKRNSQIFSVWFNDGNGTFSSDVGFSSLNDPRDAALADFDGDGDLDVIIATGTGDLPGVWFNNGSGQFGNRQHLGNSVVKTIAVGDLDGDKDIDIILGNTDILLNEGDGTFVESFNHLGSFSAEDIALGDVDHDGDLDAISVAGFNGSNRLWLNDGTGYFSQLDLDFGTDGFAVALGDLDNDGDLDAYIGHRGADKVWLNQLITAPRLPGDANGDGEFDRDDIVQVLQAGKFMTDEPASWEEGDWDGDGRFDQLDLIAALQENSYSADG